LSNLVYGLGIMIMGLVITFGALAIFIGAILLLKRLFPSRGKVEAEADLVEGQAFNSPERDTTEAEVVAAIAVALAYLQSNERCRNGLGAALEDQRSPWWVGGRLDQYPLGSLSIQRRN
jgi:Na+-transporting methylmalonyl-CoA/oxaloacetate decarboxylase gamma subunit